MPIKKPAKKRKTRKIQLSLPETLVRALDKEVRRSSSSGKPASRSSLMKEILGRGVVRMMLSDVEDAPSRADVRDSLLMESAPLVKEAAAHAAEGNRAAASRLYLAAAAREVEAISYMDMDDEASIKSALIMAVLHMKKGTGYGRLPEVGPSSSASSPVQ